RGLCASLAAWWRLRARRRLHPHLRGGHRRRAPQAAVDQHCSSGSPRIHSVHSLKGNPMKVKESIALVTGASSGIGEATAQRLAQAGYKVYGTSRRGSQRHASSFTMLPLDVTSDESVQSAVNEVIRADGRIDLLVNN